MFTYQFNSIKSKDQYIDQLFTKQADKVDKDDFLENPSSFFWNHLGVSFDIEKIIHETNKETDPTGKKAILCKAYFLFCARLASYLYPLKKESVIYPAENKEIDPKLQTLFDLSDDTETGRNMRRCRDSGLISRVKKPDGSIEYGFIDPSLIPYFIARMSYELTKLNYDMWALAVKDEKEREQLTKDPRFKKNPILFKLHDEYFIFLQMPNNECRLIDGLDANKFKEIEFPEFGQACMLRGHNTSQEIYHEIMIKRDALLAKESSVRHSPIDSISKALVPFKNLQKLTKDYQFTFQRANDQLTLTCQHYTHPSSTAEPLLASLAQLFKLAIKNIGIEEKEQYAMVIEKSKLTITAISTKSEENINTLDSIAELIEAAGYPEYPKRDTSYFQERFSQVRSTLFATSVKEELDDSKAVITCRMQ